MKALIEAVGRFLGPAPELRPLSLRLWDPELEELYQRDYVRRFCYVLSRLQFVQASVVGALLVVGYNVVILLFTEDPPFELLFADYFLIVLALIGMAAAYGLERSDRLLFLRQRELERERRRADDLLRRVGPGPDLHGVRRAGRPLGPGEDQDRGRRLHGRGGRPGPSSGPRRGGRRDGPRPGCSRAGTRSASAAWSS